MDRLELRMREPYPDERRQAGSIVEERLQLMEASVHVFNRRRDEASRLGCGTADPVL